MLDNGLAESYGDGAFPFHDFAPTFGSATASALTLCSGSDDELETTLTDTPRALNGPWSVFMFAVRCFHRLTRASDGSREAASPLN